MRPAEHAAGVTRHHRICPLCEACCGLEIETAPGADDPARRRVVSIRGAKDDPFSRGYICPKGVALGDLHDDPDRLRTPLVRRGGRHHAASWDEAFDEIARRLTPIRREHGPDAVALMVGNPVSHKFGPTLYFPRLAKALGTRNLYSASTLDQMPRHVASGLLYGQWMSVPVPDIERCGLLLVVGANPVVSNGSMWTVPDFRGKARALRARGGRIVVVDPRRTETAELADEHWPIRPGADVFVLAAMVRTLFAHGRVRAGRAAAWLADGDIAALRDAVEPFTVDRAAVRSGLDAGRIEALALAFADAAHAACYVRFGASTQRFGSAVNWLGDVLNILTGRLDEPGGAMFPLAPAFARNTVGASGTGAGVSLGRHASRVAGAAEVMGELPATCLAEEIETPGPGQVRALLTVATNPVLSTPQGPRLARAFASLDFMVSLDIYLNETTRHADVILPAPSPLQESHYDIAFSQMSWRNQARFSPPVLPVDDAPPPEWVTMLRLAAIVQHGTATVDVAEIDDGWLAADVHRRFGAQAHAVLAALGPRPGPERWLDLALRTGPYGDRFGERPDGLSLAALKAAPTGLDLGPLAPRLPGLLRTPSGRIDLAAPPLLAELARAAADLATASAPPPLVVIGRRDVRSNNSWMHNLPVLAKGPLRCTARVHPDDAARCGVADGDTAWLSRGAARIRVPVQVDDAMAPGVVSVPHGWGHDVPDTRLSLAAERPGASLNDLLDDGDRDPLSGTAVLAGVPIEMTRAG